MYDLAFDEVADWIEYGVHGEFGCLVVLFYCFGAEYAAGRIVEWMLWPLAQSGLPIISLRLATKNSLSSSIQDRYRWFAGELYFLIARNISIFISALGT